MVGLLFTSFLIKFYVLTALTTGCIACHVAVVIAYVRDGHGLIIIIIIIIIINRFV